MLEKLKLVSDYLLKMAAKYGVEVVIALSLVILFGLVALSALTTGCAGNAIVNKGGGQISINQKLDTTNTVEAMNGERKDEAQK